MTEAERLRGRGIPVKLADTSIHMLRFDWEAIAEVEDKHGSLTAYLENLNAAGKKRFTAVRDGMVAGLAQDLSSEKVRALLAPHDLRVYMDAINEALEQALPPLPKADEGKASGETADSPGPPSSAAPSSNSDSPPTASGA